MLTTLFNKNVHYISNTQYPLPFSFMVPWLYGSLRPDSALFVFPVSSYRVWTMQRTIPPSSVGVTIRTLDGQARRQHPIYNSFTQ